MSEAASSRASIFRIARFSLCELERRWQWASKPTSQQRRISCANPHSLREWRREAADKKGVPPFQVFTNAELHEIVVRRPDSANGLSQIHGIGARKVEQHAEAVLRLLAHSPEETAS